MSTVVRRHQKDTKTFEELTAKEQALAINAHTVWYLKAARAHGRKISLHKATEKIGRQIERMAAQVRNLQRANVAPGRSGPPHAARAWLKISGKVVGIAPVSKDPKSC